MDLKVNIKNLGKLTEADIRISKFTVFAGANNTGKSFVSRALYSRLSCNLGDVDVLVLSHYAYGLRQSLDILKDEGFNDSDLPLLFQHLDRFDEIVSEIKNVGQYDKIPTFEKILPALFDTCKNVRSVCTGMLNKIGSHNVGQDDMHDAMHIGAEERHFDEFVFRKSLSSFENMTEDKMRRLFKEDLANVSKINFMQNFQVKSLSELTNDKENDLNMTIKSKSLMFKQKEYVQDYLNDENYANLHILENFITDKALFLGSPLFWQLKNPLESASNSSFFNFRQRLSGVPKYFYDMVDALRSEYIGDPISSEVLDRLTGKHGINGRVSVAATGEILYAENGGVTVPLGRAATGVANMGVLALLIEKNILDENTFLFIDEPEAHLHPVWQVEIADALFKLAEAGVNVVIATHSDNILKWLEVHVNKNPKAKEIIALNHFSKEGVESIDTDRFDTGLAEIKIELTDPFANLHWEGLRHDIAR